MTNPSTWTIATTAGHTVTGYLPAWADGDPTTTHLPLDQLSTALADVSHRAYFEGPLLHVHNPASSEADERVLSGVVVCAPYAEDPDPRMPVVNVAIVADHWINHLDPDGLAEVAAKLRAQADRLDHEIRPQLLAARADWAAHHSA